MSHTDDAVPATSNSGTPSRQQAQSDTRKLGAKLTLPYPKDSRLHHEIAKWAARTPQQTALVQEGKTLSYRELDKQATQLAASLLRRGLTPGMLVGLCVPRSMKMVVSMLAILKVGAAYLPLDPAYPAERLMFMLKDSGVTQLLTCKQAPDLASFGGTTQLLEALTVSDLDEPDDGLPDTQDHHLAYCMYTSGSTGQPKGVLISHRGILRLCLGAGLSYTPQDVFLQSSSMTFDASTWEIWTPLLNGATLVLLPAGPVDVEQVAEAITDYQINTLGLSTGLFHLLVDRAIDRLASIRRLVVGGEVMSVQHARRLLLAWPDCELINGYGPTENTTATTYHRVTMASLGRSVPIGRPLANTDVYVFTDSGALAEIGETGELYTGGDGLALGYLNRPEEMASRFVTHPFSPGEQLYRTGDRVCWREDGTLAFHGRADDQIKVRGYRIEPAEVVHALAACAGVQSAAVMAYARSGEDSELVAYFTVVPGHEPPPVSTLRAQLASVLPSHMIPSAFVAMEVFPLTPNGKLDRSALPAPGTQRPLLSTVYVAPANTEERLLSAIWEDVLGIQPIGCHDNFFELGGHSLRATQIVARVMHQFAVTMTVGDLFMHPTVRACAEHLQHMPKGMVEAFPKVSRQIGQPLSLSQERVWFLESLSPDLRAYNAQATLRMKGKLNVAVLERALSDVVARHEVLRTTFHAGEGQPFQRVELPWQVTLSVVTFEDLDAGEREGALQAVIRDAILRPFAVGQLPLVRWYLFRLSAEDHVLLHVEHHFVHDGWSFSIFLNELRALYLSGIEGTPATLSSPSGQYIDYACWQRLWLQSAAAAKQLDYWKGQLSGLPPVLELPTDRPRPPVQSFRGSAQRITLPSTLMTSFRALCQKEQVSLFMGLYAVFVTLLHRLTGVEDLCVGTAVANRRLRESEGMMGMMVNTIALRVNFSGNPTFRSLLHQVRQVTLDGYAHQELPFDRVVEALAPERSLAYSPICQSLFSFHDAPMPDLNWDGTTIEITEAINNGSAKFDLDVVVIPRPEQYQGSAGADGAVIMIWEYMTDLFDADSIDRLIGRYVQLLEQIVASPEQQIGDFSILLEAEQALLLNQWAGTGVIEAAPLSIVQQFETQVAATPSAIALQAAAQTLRYDALNRRANQIADELRACGVQPEHRVGLCLPRSFDMVAALLGILKAGGAYVPLDPAYPRERLDLMIEDAGLTAMVTHSLLQEQLPTTLTTVLLDQLTEPAPEHDRNPHACLQPDQLAYVIYTSGSTGKPKGVLLEHRSVSHLVQATAEAFQLTASDRVLQFASINFDNAVEEIFPTLCRGACLVLRPDPLPGSEEFYRWVAAQNMSVLHLPTAYWHEWVHALAVQKQSLPDCVRLVVAGGEKVLAPRFADWQSINQNNAQFINTYGPTEATVDATHWSPDPVGKDPLPDIPIGRPIPHARVYVLDRYRKLMPPGVAGELFIGGAGIARGYHARPDLTAERFVSDPFTFVQGGRLYRSGDLVRFNRQGELLYLGRVDHQVKLRGFRIELGEIEAALTRLPEVREALVSLYGEAPQQRLVAYVVSSHDTSLDAGTLRQALAQQLPEYMVPSQFVMLDTLPLLPNGKVNRAALPVPSVMASSGYQAPDGELECLLAELWASLLGVSQISRHDNFFNSGGHSLMAMQLVARIRNEWGLSLPLSAVFEAPTVALQARRLETLINEDESLSSLLDELEALSDDEAARLLSDTEPQPLAIK